MSIILMFGVDERMAMEAHLLTNLSAHLNSALNPFFYFLFNPKMRTGYINFFDKCCCKCMKKKKPSSYVAVAEKTKHSTAAAAAAAATAEMELIIAKRPSAYPIDRQHL